MINNSSPQSWSSSADLLSHVKAEPMSYGQYGCQPYSIENQQHQPSLCDEILGEDLKDIKLEDLCYLNTEVNDFALHDARPCDQFRNSVSPQSYCSSDLDCGGSPASSTAESWFSTGSSDHVVPGASPQHTPCYQTNTEDRKLYVDTSISSGGKPMAPPAAIQSPYHHNQGYMTPAAPMNGYLPPSQHQVYHHR